MVILFLHSTHLGKPCSGCWGHVFFVPRRRNSSECICEYYPTEHAEAYKVPHAPGNRCRLHMFHIYKSEINICCKVGASGFIYYQDVSASGMESHLQSWSGLTFSYFRESVCDKLANETARSMRFRRKHVCKLDIPQN